MSEADTPDWLLLEDVVKWLDNKINHSVKAQRNPENAEWWRKCRDAVRRALARENQRTYNEAVKADLETFDRIIHRKKS